MANSGHARAKRRPWRVTRFQKPVQGGRDSLPASVLKPIRAWVDKEARKNGVSRSFVVATVLAHHIGGIVGQEDYEEEAQ